MRPEDDPLIAFYEEYDGGARAAAGGGPDSRDPAHQHGGRPADFAYPYGYTHAHGYYAPYDPNVYAYDCSYAPPAPPFRHQQHLQGELPQHFDAGSARHQGTVHHTSGAEYLYPGQVPSYVATPFQNGYPYHYSTTPALQGPYAYQGYPLASSSSPTPGYPAPAAYPWHSSITTTTDGIVSGQIYQHRTPYGKDRPVSQEHSSRRHRDSGKHASGTGRHHRHRDLNEDRQRSRERDRHGSRHHHHHGKSSSAKREKADRRNRDRPTDRMRQEPEDIAQTPKEAQLREQLLHATALLDISERSREDLAVKMRTLASRNNASVPYPPPQQDTDTGDALPAALRPAERALPLRPLTNHISNARPTSKKQSGELQQAAPRQPAVQIAPPLPPPQKAAAPTIPLPVVTQPIPELRTKEPINRSYSDYKSIKTLPTTVVPDIFRSLFKFKDGFNQVQSVCFPYLYKSDENMVITAPTGAGKTVLFELAILRVFCKPRKGGENGDAGKIVYIAPTKSLCSERVRDWASKFGHFRISCVELTGDSDDAGSSAAREAQIIVTTPEKWDSVTRRGTAKAKWYKTVKLFCIDEVHLLAEDRGATVEVIVSRMKGLKTDLRFVAVSATVPNIEDVAAWLGFRGGDATGFSKKPAHVFKFSEEFRPCPLKKIVEAYPSEKSDHAFENTLNFKLFGLIKDHADGKPVLVFCNTRKGCEAAAKQIAVEYEQVCEGRGTPPWPRPNFGKVPPFGPGQQSELARAGVGYHHAGLAFNDRKMTEKLFLDNKLQVICTTSTLAVGVNLPARMVIIKNTKIYNFDQGKSVDYSDLEILQMMGRAGRKQFDNQGVAVIMTSKDKKEQYDRLAGSETVLESCLHQTLTEHINSEISIKTISTVEDALLWLQNSFLYVRIKKNPRHYRVVMEAAAEGEQAEADDLDESFEVCLERLVRRALKNLVDEQLVVFEDGVYKSTQYGDMLCAFNVRFKTFSALKAMPAKADMSTVLATIAKAEEFSETRLRGGEKNFYQDTINKMVEIKYPLKEVSDPTDKVQLLIQLALSGMDLHSLKGPGGSINSEAYVIMHHAGRVTQCLVELALLRKDPVTAKNVLELRRCISGRMWDDSQNVFRQIPEIGVKVNDESNDPFAEHLYVGGIRTINDLRKANPRRIEMLCSRTTPWGDNVLANALEMPDFTLSLKMVAEEMTDEGNSVTLEAKVTIHNEPTDLLQSRRGKAKPKRYNLSLLLRTSDNQWIAYERKPFLKIAQDPARCATFRYRALLRKPSSHIIGTLTCDELVGSKSEKLLNATTPASRYPNLPAGADDFDLELDDDMFDPNDKDPLPDFVPTASNRWSGPPKKQTAAAKPPAAPAKRKKDMPLRPIASPKGDNIAIKLPNGNYRCSHTNCKANCNHGCCREGVKRPSKKRLPPTNVSPSAKNDKGMKGSKKELKQTQLPRKQAPKAKKLHPAYATDSDTSFSSGFKIRIPPRGGSSETGASKGQGKTASKVPTAILSDVDDEESLPDITDALSRNVSKKRKERSRSSSPELPAPPNKAAKRPLKITVRASSNKKVVESSPSSTSGPLPCLSMTPISNDQSKQKKKSTIQATPRSSPTSSLFNPRSPWSSSSPEEEDDADDEEALESDGLGEDGNDSVFGDDEPDRADLPDTPMRNYYQPRKVTSPTANNSKDKFNTTKTNGGKGKGKVQKKPFGRMHVASFIDDAASVSGSDDDDELSDGDDSPGSLRDWIDDNVIVEDDSGSEEAEEEDF